MSSIDRFSFKAPFTAAVVGPTSGGKSVIVKKILDDNQDVIEPSPDRIVYCIPKLTDEYSYLNNITPRVQFIEGLPDINMFSKDQNNLLILDDLMTEAEQSSTILDLFTTDSHHSNISVIMTKQNLFSQNKHSRSIALNCHYLIILNNPRDKAQIHHLARQMFPNKSNFLIEAYEDATQEKYGYLFLDFKQSTDNKHRVQSGILPDQTRMVYMPK
jgi:hypothetical protein